MKVRATERTSEPDWSIQDSNKSSCLSLSLFCSYTLTWITWIMLVHTLISIGKCYHDIRLKYLQLAVWLYKYSLLPSMHVTHLLILWDLTLLMGLSLLFLWMVCQPQINKCFICNCQRSLLNSRAEEAKIFTKEKHKNPTNPDANWRRAQIITGRRCSVEFSTSFAVECLYSQREIHALKITEGRCNYCKLQEVPGDASPLQMGL